MHRIATLAMLAPLIVVVPVCLYVAALTLAAPFRRVRRGGRLGRLRSFAILIPAHNEDAVIERLFESIGALDYPTSAHDVWVVADNCTDATAFLARQRGAFVRERQDTRLRGKGHALRWLLETMAGEGRRYDAYVILDADSVISPNFLAAMNAHLSAGCSVLQGYYTVLPVTGRPSERLREAALALVHFVRPAAKAALRLSCGLKGNGMCFDRSVIERFGWPTSGLAEDVEAHLTLVRAGLRVDFVPEAVVRGEMPDSFRASRTQQERWEAGRLATLRHWALPLLLEGLRGRNAVKADAAIEQMVPPLSLPAVLAALATGGGLAIGAPVVWLTGSLCLVLLATHVAAGLAIAHAPVAVYRALPHAAPYIGWKSLLYARALLRPNDHAWIRTSRQAETPALGRGLGRRPD